MVFFINQDQQIYSVHLLRIGAIGFLSKNLKGSVMAGTINKIKSYKLHINDNFKNELKLDLEIENPEIVLNTFLNRN